MTRFTTPNLRKVVSLSYINSYADLIEVKDATYEGDTYPEGTVSLNIPKGDAMMFRYLINFDQLLKNVWPSAFFQLGVRNKKPVLFVYERHEI